MGGARLATHTYEWIRPAAGELMPHTPAGGSAHAASTLAVPQGRTAAAKKPTRRSPKAGILPDVCTIPLGAPGSKGSWQLDPRGGHCGSHGIAMIPASALDLKS